jgi:hypothetical protein
MRKWLKALLLLIQNKKSIEDKKLYIVFWEDISANTAWVTPDEVSNQFPAICVSFGCIWNSDPEKTHVVSDLGFDILDDKLCLNEVGSVTTIPTKNILKKIEIPLKFKV